MIKERIERKQDVIHVNINKHTTDVLLKKEDIEESTQEMGDTDKKR